MGCESLPLAHTKVYQPSSNWEEAELKSSDFNIFPDDIRGNIEGYKNAKVAWAGIIKDTQYHETASNIQLGFIVEHHYFDWVQDQSVQRAKFFLSPNGEGKISAVWSIKKNALSAEIQEASKAGNMIVMYGTPHHVENGIVYLSISYVRTFPSYLFRTDVMDYGRPGEPVELINVPLK